ncbi:MAG: DUF493 domain-containing protein [Gammaproteobacteria bacterium]
MNDRDEKPIMEFPCQFPIKVMGAACDDFENIVATLVRQHVPDLGEAAICSRPSKAGKYIAVTVTVTATSREQLDAIYYELTACEQVLMAL